jgi:hypothetical protein
MLKRILIIDDDCETPEYKEKIQTEFQDSDIEFHLCSTKDEGLELIKTKMLFDCIVLDWYLEEENSSLSRLILSELKDNYFAPVLIYSNHAANFRSEQEEGTFEYPKNLIKEVDKDNFSDIKAKTEEWINSNYTAQLANIYLSKIYDGIHKTFIDLIEIPTGDIGSVLKKVVKVGDTIDWSNDFILGRLTQKLINDDEFREKLSLVVNQIPDNPATTSLEKKKIAQKILYFNNKSSYISNGDLIKISIQGVNPSNFYGIVINPECDLVQGNSRYIEVVKLKDINSLGLNTSEIGGVKSNKNESHFFFPSLYSNKQENEVEEFIDLVAVFKSKHIILSSKTDGVTKYPKVTSRLKFTDSLTFENNNCTIEYVSSLVNPYKSEFFTKKNSHDSRVGIPNIYEYLKG